MLKNNAIKKSVFALIACATLAMFVTGCDKDTENKKNQTSNESPIDAATERAYMQAAVNSAYGISDAARYVYISSLLTDETITSGSAADLKVSGTPVTSGTWKLLDDNNDLIIMLEDVVIDNYICNTNEEKVIECEKIK